MQHGVAQKMVSVHTMRHCFSNGSGPKNRLTGDFAFLFFADLNTNPQGTPGKAREPVSG